MVGEGEVYPQLAELALNIKRADRIFRYQHEMTMPTSAFQLVRMRTNANDSTTCSHSHHTQNLSHQAPALWHLSVCGCVYVLSGVCMCALCVRAGCGHAITGCYHAAIVRGCRSRIITAHR